jgi:hypothetical protein
MQGAGTPAGHNYIKPHRISLKNHPTLHESWVQDQLANDPPILGLGDNLSLLGKEVSLPGGGRLDLLFKNGDKERYEVEVQLGATDPSHIIRTIEYWDLQRGRYPEYEHVAVLVAEDITSRFLNVVSLLNKSIPLIAIQMQAMEVGPHLTLVFTTVVDRFTRPDVEEGAQQPADRAYWEKKSQGGLAIVDELAGFAETIDSGLALRYTLGYVRVIKQGQAFLTFVPQKAQTKIRIYMTKTAESEDLKGKILHAGVAVDYKEKANKSRYKIAVENEKFNDSAVDIKALVKLGLESSQ